MRRARIVLVLALVALAAPAVGRADGPTVGPSSALVDQLFSADGRHDFVVTKQPRTTLVEERDTQTRRLLHRIVLPGQLGLPVVTAGASAQANLGGLALDGRTLVLEQLPLLYPPAQTRFVVLDTTWRRPPHSIALPGAFAFDALSPHGRLLYLLQDRHHSLFIDYAVRTYDLRRHELRERLVVDRREPNEAMQGYPIARTWQPDGSWVYTLYMGGRHPFVHALHATNATAACIDLPLRQNVLASQPGLYLDGHGRLVVDGSGRTLAFIDTRTLRLRLPHART